MRTDLGTASDVTLAMAVARWDQEALAEVYRRNAGAVYGLARRVLGDDAAAEEAVQEVFLRFWNEPARFDPDRGALRAFLLAQVHSRAVDILRSDAARRRREERDARSSTSGQYDIEHEFWDLAVAEGVREAVRSLHARREKRHRTGLFRRSYVQGGRHHPRRARGYCEKPDPFRYAPDAIVVGSQRAGYG